MKMCVLKLKLFENLEILTLQFGFQAVPLEMIPNNSIRMVS